MFNFLKSRILLNFCLIIFSMSIMTFSKSTQAQSYDDDDGDWYSSGSSGDNFINADGEYATGLLESFNSFCPTTGNWTINSLEEARKIERVLENQRDDPDCVEVSQSMAVHVKSLSGALSRIKMGTEQRNINAKQKQQIDLLFLLKEEADMGRRGALTDLFRQNELDLALQRGGLDYDEEQARNDYLSSMIVNSSIELFRQAAQGQKCLMKSPQLMSGIVSILGHMGAGLASGGTSLIFAGASSIFGHAMEYFRKSKLNEQIQKLAQDKFVSAYQCVLESLSNQWCEAREVYDLIELKTASRSMEEDSFFQGINILNREMHILLSWLRYVRTATAPVNLPMARLRQEFIDKESDLRKWRLETLARLSHAETRVPGGLGTDIDRKRQYNVLVELVGNLLPDMESRSFVIGGSPLYEFATLQEFPWLLAGIPLEKVPFATSNLGNMGLLRFGVASNVFLKEPNLAPYYPLDLETIRSQVESLFQSAYDRVTQERSGVMYADPSFLLGGAHDTNYWGPKNIRGISPFQSINTILDYFHDSLGENSFLCDGGEPRDEDLTNPNPNLEFILCQIKKRMEHGGEDYEKSLSEVFELASLINGENFIEFRMRIRVRAILMGFLRDASKGGEIPIQQKLLLADGIINNLQLYRSSSLTGLKFDLRNALRSSENTLQNFTEIFSKSLSKTVKVIYEKSQDPFFEQDLAKYCSLLLSVPNWRSPMLSNIGKEILPFCEGAFLRSEWGDKEENEPFEFVFSSKDYHSKFDRRKACHFRRFIRNEQFQQNY